MLAISSMLFGNVCNAAETGGTIQYKDSGERTILNDILYKARAKGYSVDKAYHYTKTEVYLWITQEIQSAPKTWGKGKVWCSTNYTRFTCTDPSSFEFDVTYGYGYSSTK